MNVTIGNVRFRADNDLVNDLRLALSSYHARLAKRIGTTGRMTEASKLSTRLVTVQKAYEQFSE